MAHVHTASPNFCSGSDAAGYETQGHAACKNPVFWGSRGDPAGTPVPQKPRVIDVRLDANLEQSPAHVPPHHGVAHASVHASPGSSYIEMPCADKSLAKMIMKLQALGKAPRGEELPMSSTPLQPPAMQLDMATYGIVPPAPGTCFFWAHEAWGLEKQGGPSQTTAKSSGGPTDANSSESLLSDDHSFTMSEKNAPELTWNDHNLTLFGKSLPRMTGNIHSLTLPENISGGMAKQTPRGMTTLMVRNVPLKYTQQLLLKEWSNHDGIYDFLYLPRSSDGPTNMSFAFINFVSEAHAVAFKAQWHKQRMARFTARKPLNIGFADVQGLRANILKVTKKFPSGYELVPRNQPYIFLNGMHMGPDEALAIVHD